MDALKDGFYGIVSAEVLLFPKLYPPEDPPRKLQDFPTPELANLPTICMLGLTFKFSAERVQLSF